MIQVTSVSQMSGKDTSTQIHLSTSLLLLLAKWSQTDFQVLPYMCMCVLTPLVCSTVGYWWRVLFYSFKYNQQDATLYNILYCCQCSTCFRRFLRPSSGAQNCTHSISYMSSLLAATTSVGVLQLTHTSGVLQLTHTSGSSKQAWHIPDAVCTVLSSWGWAEKPPETCRALTAIKNIV